MKIKINPKINFYQLEYYLKDSLDPRLIKNAQIYSLVKELTSRFYPSYKDKLEKRWEDFYLPLRRSGKEIALPFKIIKYKRDYFCYFFRLGSLRISKGKKDTEEIYKKIFQEALRFTRLIERKGAEILKKIVPYDLRTGKIKGKYIFDKVLSLREKEKIEKDYKAFLKKNIKLKGCSLNEYLEVASICYKAAYGKKVSGLNPLQMYKKFADGRDGGMLSIKNWASKKEFLDWYKNKRWIGSHPFEIVFSWHRHGVYLYPPSSYNDWRYGLRVVNYAYAEDFIKMVKALIKRRIPFVAYDLEKVLDYLRGETYFTVNTYSDNFFFYIPSVEHKKKYFKHIEWDELKILKPVSAPGAKMRG